MLYMSQGFHRVWINLFKSNVIAILMYKSDNLIKITFSFFSEFWGWPRSLIYQHWSCYHEWVKKNINLGSYACFF